MLCSWIFGVSYISVIEWCFWFSRDILVEEVKFLQKECASFGQPIGIFLDASFEWFSYHIQAPDKEDWL